MRPLYQMRFYHLNKLTQIYADIDLTSAFFSILTNLSEAVRFQLASPAVVPLQRYINSPELYDLSQNLIFRDLDSLPLIQDITLAHC